MFIIYASTNISQIHFLTHGFLFPQSSALAFPVLHMPSTRARWLQACASSTLDKSKDRQGLTAKSWVLRGWARGGKGFSGFLFSLLLHISLFASQNGFASTFVSGVAHIPLHTCEGQRTLWELVSPLPHGSWRLSSGHPTRQQVLRPTASLTPVWDNGALSSFEFFKWAFKLWFYNYLS